MKTASLLVAALVALPVYAHAGAPALHLTVHGSLDGAVLGARLAEELGADVELVEGTCELPCLAVTVDGKNTATVIYAPRSGPPRQRELALGNDTAQWPLVVTLLAGNVVRDEAQDVMAGLPPDLPGAPAELMPGEAPPPPDEVEVAAGPPPPEPPAVVVPVAPPRIDADPEPRERRLFGFGLVPVLSTDLTHVGEVSHALSFDLLVGVSGGTSGLAISGIADIERGQVAGAQLGGVVTVAGTVAAGFQLSGVAAIARRVAGTQVAGAAAVAGEVDGVQIAGAAAVASSVSGVQVGGVAAVSRAGAATQVGGVAAVAHGNAGFQAGGVAAVARGDAGFQAGGVTSVAHGTVGVQVAGVVNVASEVTGLQVAPINVARRVDGVQIGVINIGSAEGFSLGLINIVPGGRYDLETTVDSDRIGTLLFRHGGRHWHNVYGVAGQETNNATGPKDTVWMYGFGFGPSWRFDNNVIDLELVGWHVNHGSHYESDDLSVLGQLRLSIAHHWGPFAIVAGGAFNAYVTDDRQSPLYIERTTLPTPPAMQRSNVTTQLWPSAFVGIRL